jgi:hypothetical protein
VAEAAGMEQPNRSKRTLLMLALFLQCPIWHARWRRCGAAVEGRGGGGRSARARSRLADQLGIGDGPEIYVGALAALMELYI